MTLSTEEKQYKFCPSCKAKLQRNSIDGRIRSTCPNCGFVFWNNPKPVVSVLLYNDSEEILMLQRASEPLKDYWCLPGGYINYDETPPEAIKREVREEIGIDDLVPEGLIGVYRIDNDPRGVNIDIIYRSRIPGKVVLSDEHRNYGFFSVDNLPEEIAYKHRDAINDWLQERDSGK